MILIGALLTLAAPFVDSVPVVRRVAATSQLAAQEYAVGVVNGRVVAQAEVDEARLFLQDARRAAEQLPEDGSRPAIASIDSVLRLVAALAPPDTVAARVRALSTGLAERFRVTLDELPARPPQLTRGAEIYQSSCASCHGVAGAGDGPMAAGLEPVPANLTDWKALSDQSPLDYYRRISIGVVGTAMPAFEGRLPAEDRWAVALYASLLRLPAPSGEPPPALTAFATTGRMSDVEVLKALGTEDLSRVASVRAVQAKADEAASVEILARVREQVDSVLSLAASGNPSATSGALDAYMTFEQVERSVRAKDPALAAQLEADFAALRTRAAGASPEELAAVRRGLHANLVRAEQVLGGRMRPLNQFVQSFAIMLREGLEAILIIGALMTFLVKMGAGQRRRDINLGVGAAIVASLVTAVALETVFQLSPANREALEGFTMLLATLVLFYVSYWLLSKMEVMKWNHFVKSKVQDAVTSGSALALASAAFLAVYREGFETVLFYKALFLASDGSAGAAPVLGGMVAGGVILAGVYVAIHRFGVRLPLKPFFGVTSAFLYYTAFVFAGRGIAELQAASLISTTPVRWAPLVPALGIFPTVESLLLQGLLLVLLVAALVWTFVIEPRRLRVSNVPLPAPAPISATVAAASVPMRGMRSGSSFDLIRSFERMDADLAELRAEVERMKRHVHELYDSRSV
ncbi:MAG: FTR1 family protein [Gemmatimonadales bacterium]